MRMGLELLGEEEKQLNKKHFRLKYVPSKKMIPFGQKNAQSGFRYETSAHEFILEGAIELLITR